MSVPRTTATTPKSDDGVEDARAVSASVATVDQPLDTGLSQAGQDNHSPPAFDEERPERLAAALGLTFRDLGFLRLALTHRSVLHDWVGAGAIPLPAGSNERLEFLGDAILGAIVAEHLYASYPTADEGTLTGLRVTLVRAETLVAWAREIGLGDYLYLGQGERITAGARDRMLAGAFEALIGAIYLDQGSRATKRFLRRFLPDKNAPMVVPEEEANAKGLLQEVLQERFRLAPAYRMVTIEGPPHARVFTADVRAGDRVLGQGAAGSKRAAEQEAARVALSVLANHPDLTDLTRLSALPDEAPVESLNGIGVGERQALSAEPSTAGEQRIDQADEVDRARMRKGGGDIGTISQSPRSRRARPGRGEE